MGTSWDDVSFEFLTGLFHWPEGSFDSYQLELPVLDGYRTLGLFLVLYLGYYLFFVVSKPRVVGGGKDFRDHILTHCPCLSRCYWPTPWAFHVHLTTILRTLLQKRPPVDYRRELLVLSDGGEVALDWAESKRGGAGELNTKSPIMLILPGIVGNSSDAYVQHFAWDGLIEGYRSVVLNHRGMGGVALKTPRTYCAANTDDLQEVMARIKSYFPMAPIIGVGISLGGMQLTQYLHKTGPDCDLKAAMVICSPWDIFKTQASMEEQTFNRLFYCRFIVNNLKGLVRRNLNILAPSELNDSSFDADHVLQAETVTQFDTRLTAPMFGFSSVREYYSAGSNYDKVHKIMRPFLCLTAADDPFVPKDSIPFAAFEENPLTVLAVTSHGGHFGYLEGLLPVSCTWMNSLCRQYLKALRHYQE